MNENINVSKDNSPSQSPPDWINLATIALIAWIIAHLVALIVLTIVNPYFQNLYIYNAIYLTVVIGIAMLMIDYKIPEKIMEMVGKKRTKETESPIVLNLKKDEE